MEAGFEGAETDRLIAALGGKQGRHSTQEAAWTLLAANAVIGDFDRSGILVNGAEPDGPVVEMRRAGLGAAAVPVLNRGSQGVEITLTTLGVPTFPAPAGGNGYAIKREYFDKDGNLVNPSSVGQGQRLVAVITVVPFGRQEARLMVNDPLPAGFEIDNPNLLQSGEISGFDWLQTAPTQNVEFRSDRFLAAVDWRSDKPFQLAYRVRAVSPGSFHHPAVSVEDMYRPDMRANGNTGRVLVLP